MRKALGFSFLLFAVLLSAGATQVFGAPDDSASASAAASNASLKIRVSTDKAVYKLGQPITISLAITNIGLGEIEWSAWRPPFGIVNLSLLGTNGAPIASEGTSGFSMINLQATHLAVGKTLIMTAPLSAWGYNITQSGKYYLSASSLATREIQLSGSADPVLADFSDPISFRIK